MVGLGTYMATVSLWALLVMARGGRLGQRRALLRALVAGGPMGFIAIEAGWTVTEVGRQPWIVYGILRTADALTPMPGLVVPLATFTTLYCMLGAIVAWLLTRLVLTTAAGAPRGGAATAHSSPQSVGPGTP